MVSLINELTGNQCTHQCIQTKDQDMDENGNADWLGWERNLTKDLDQHNLLLRPVIALHRRNSVPNLGRIACGRSYHPTSLAGGMNHKEGAGVPRATWREVAKIRNKIDEYVYSEKAARSGIC